MWPQHLFHDCILPVTDHVFVSVLHGASHIYVRGITILATVLTKSLVSVLSFFAHGDHTHMLL